MQIVCTSLQTDNHTSTSPLRFYRPDAFPAAHLTVSKHWRHKSLDNSMAGWVVSSLVSSRLHYVNSILYGMSLKNIHRLQRIQYSLARVVTYRHSHALPSSTALLKHLHWLPVEWRIWFKLATMTFKALHTRRPPYLTDQLQYYQPTRSLHSSGFHQLVKPRHNLSFGSRAFRISAAHIWNSLPTNIREAQSVLTFRRHLKMHYFQSAFSTP